MRAKTTGLFLLMLSLTLGYQAVYVHVTAPGEWSALFFNGSLVRHPDVRNFGYTYADSHGYDGQFYRVLALDPLLTKGLKKYLDDPRYRARRILIPGIAGVLGNESLPAVDYWFIGITDVAMALGGLCFVRLAKDCCPPATSAILYLFIPAIMASTDRMVVDGPAVAGFLAALLFYRERRTVPLMMVLAALPLIRETALPVTCGVMLAYIVAKEFLRMLVAATTALPAIGWWIYVAMRTPPSNTARVLSIPWVPQVIRLFTLVPHPGSPLLNFALDAVDFVAMACLLLAFALFAKRVIREMQRARAGIEGWEEICIVLPVMLLAAIASGREILGEPYAFMRVDSLLIAWAALELMRRRPLWAAIYLPACSAGVWMYRVKPLFRLIRVSW